MLDDPMDDLVCACVSFVGTQRRLLDLLAEPDTGTDAVATAMSAELDQLATAIRRSRPGVAPPQPRRPGEPGE